MAQGPIIRRPRIGLAIAIGIVLGLAGTLALLRAATPPPRYMVDPTLRYTYRYDGSPTETQVEVAKALRRAGDEALADGDLGHADLYYGQCIEMSNAKACHAALASILYLLRDQAAHAHYLAWKRGASTN